MSSYLDQHITVDLNDLEESEFETVEDTISSNPTTFFKFWTDIINYKPTNYKKYDPPIFQHDTKDADADDYIYTESPVYIQPNLQSSIRNSLTQEPSHVMERYGMEETITTLSPWDSVENSHEDPSSINSILNPNLNKEKIFHTLQNTYENTLLGNPESMAPKQKMGNITTETTKIVESTLSNILKPNKNTTETIASVAENNGFSTTYSPLHTTEKITQITKNLSMENTTSTNIQEPSSIMDNILKKLQNPGMEQTRATSETSSIFQNIIDTASSTEIRQNGTADSTLQTTEKITQVTKNLTMENTTSSNIQEPSSIMENIFKKLQNQSMDQIKATSENSSMFQNIIDTVSSTEIRQNNATENPLQTTDKITEITTKLTTENSTFNNIQEPSFMMDNLLKKLDNPSLKPTIATSEHSITFQNIIDAIGSTENRQNNTTDSPLQTTKITQITKNLLMENTTSSNIQKTSSVMDNILKKLQNPSMEQTRATSENSSMFQNIIDTVGSTDMSTGKDTITYFESKIENNSTTSYIKNIFSSSSSAENYSNPIRTPNLAENITTTIRNIPHNSESSKTGFTTQITETIENVLTPEESTITASNNYIDTSMRSTDKYLQTTLERVLTSLQDKIREHIKTDSTTNPTQTKITQFKKLVSEQDNIAETASNYSDSSQFLSSYSKTANVLQNAASVLEETTRDNSDANVLLETTVKQIVTDVQDTLMGQLRTAATSNSTENSVYKDITEATPIVTKLTNTVTQQEISTSSTPRNISSIMEDIFSSTKPYFKSTHNYSSNLQTTNTIDTTKDGLQNMSSFFEDASTVPSSTEVSFRRAVKHVLKGFQHGIIEHSKNISTENFTNTAKFGDINHFSTVTSSTELQNMVSQHTTIADLTPEPDIPSTVQQLFSSIDRYLASTTDKISDITETNNFTEGTTEVVKNITLTLEDTSSLSTESILKNQYFTPTIKNILTDLQTKSLQQTPTKLPNFESRFGDFSDSDDVTETLEPISMFEVTTETPIFSSTVEPDPDQLFDGDRWLVYVGMGFVGAVVLLFMLSVFIYMYVRKMKRYSNYRLTRTRDSFSNVCTGP